MRIVFIQKDKLDHLGIMSVAAVMREAKHEVSVLIVERGDVLANSVAALRPDLVCASATTGEHLWVIDKFAQIKMANPDISTLMGGPHPTFFPKVIHNKYVDYICVNEGEPCIAAFCKKLESGKSDASTGNIVNEKGVKLMALPPLVSNLDDYPMPVRELYYNSYPLLRDNPAKHFMASRGCVYNCSFCYNSSLKKLYKGQKMIRIRSPRRMVDEIKATREAYPLETVRFVDDIFGVNTHWLREFHERYKGEVNLPYSCFQRADIMTPERAKLLRESGCFLVFFAIESGVEKIRNDVLQKKITNEQIIECAKMLRQEDIEIATFNMLGIPGETYEDSWETVRINIKVRADYPIATLCQPYPKTKLETIALETGVLDKEMRVDNFSSRTSRKSLLRQEGIIKLQRLHRFFYVAVKLPKLIPLIRVLVELPLDWLYYSLVFSASHAHRYYHSCKMSPRRFLKDLKRLARFYWS